MRIKKVTQTTPVQAHLTNSYSTSTEDGYSCNYINEFINDTGSNYLQIGEKLIIWGVKTASAAASTGTDITITFPKRFANTNYSFVVMKSTIGNSTALYPTISTKSVNQCVLNVYNSHSGAISNNYNYIVIGDAAL